MKLPHLASVMLMAVLLAACGTPPADAERSEPTVAPDTDAPRTTPTAAARTPTPTAAATPTARAGPPPVADEPPPLAIEPVATGLDAPTNVATAPDGWLVVNERAGRIVGVQPGSDTMVEVADLRDRVLGRGEQGLLGLALHPDWPDTPRAFVHYTGRSGQTVLSEIAGEVAGDGAPRLDPGSERILLELDQPYPNHNGGQLAFGPDGMLWMALGDGGAGGDPHGHGQDPATLLGTLLRLDVSQPGRLAVPDDNPFVDGGGAPEVALSGLRNPWRFSFDRHTGELWIADVGQSALEEVNRLDPVADLGANLGWNVMEGSRCFADPECARDELVLPVTEYGRDGGCSITGGFVYRGTAIGDLAGWYLFSDYCSGILFGIPSDVDRPTEPVPLLQMGIAASAFGEDIDGELYVADLDGGTLSRVVAGD